MGSEDLQLVQLAKQGDHEAFRTLMNTYRKRVYSLAYGMVHDAEGAMDICQETFIKAYRHLDSFQGNSSFYTWIYRIAANLSIDHLRKRSRREALQYDDHLRHDDSEETEAALTSHMADTQPQLALDRKELKEKLNQALETLSEKHRIVLILRELEGMSYEEIASTLNIHLGTVMSRLHHARKNMQKELSGYLSGLPAGEEEATDEDEQAGSDETADLPRPPTGRERMGTKA